MHIDQLGEALVSSTVLAVLGVAVFAAAFWLITKLTPFSIRKEIEQDHNTALAILVGSFILGLALIVSAAIHG